MVLVGKEQHRRGPGEREDGDSPEDSRTVEPKVRCCLGSGTAETPVCSVTGWKEQEVLHAPICPASGLTELIQFSPYFTGQRGKSVSDLFGESSPEPECSRGDVHCHREAK